MVVPANEFEYTMNELLDIMDRARLEYEKFYWSLDSYLNSSVVQEFKIRFMGNKPLDLSVLEYWIAVFTHLSFRKLFPWEYKLVCPFASIQLNLKSMISIETMPDIGIWDARSAYYLNPVHICKELYIYGTGYKDAFEIDPTSSSLIVFTPSKFITLIYTITQLVNDTLLLTSEKYMLLFELVVRVFGVGEEYMVMWTLSVLFRYCSIQQDLGMFMESPVEYNDYDDESLATEFGIVKNVMFTPEVKKIFEVYLADQEETIQ
jgi:hypothetical protein